MTYKQVRNNVSKHVNAMQTQYVWKLKLLFYYNINENNKTYFHNVIQGK